MFSSPCARYDCLLASPVALFLKRKKMQPPSAATGHTSEPMHDSGADAADVDRVLAGDTSAFEPIAQRWQRPLVNLAYRFCGDRARAEDLAQEAFLRAFRGLRGWRREAAFSTWLFALATNLFRSELARFPIPTVTLSQLPELPSNADRHDFREAAVRRAVATLPPKYRDAVTLFYFHDMNIQAAAHSLSIPEGTLKARLSRARDMLRRKLGEEGS
jgi:RNA polymerase sigma-70 factor (ECF subfamily)